MIFIHPLVFTCPCRCTEIEITRARDCYVITIYTLTGTKHGLILWKLAAHPKHTRAHIWSAGSVAHSNGDLVLRRLHI